MPAYTHTVVRFIAVSALALVVLVIGLARHPPRAVTARPPLLGTRHPIWITQIGPGHRWVVARQARDDSDGDGRIAVRRTDHGWAGDALQAYLFIDGAGEGLAIDRVVSASVDGRWVIVARDGAEIAFDTARGADYCLGRPAPATSEAAVRAASWFDRADIGADDHGRVLREIMPRPEGSALAWGPLRWDER